VVAQRVRAVRCEQRRPPEQLRGARARARARCGAARVALAEGAEVGEERAVVRLQPQRVLQRRPRPLHVALMHQPHPPELRAPRNRLRPRPWPPRGAASPAREGGARARAARARGRRARECGGFVRVWWWWGASPGGRQ